MKISLSTAALSNFVLGQLNCFFPDRKVEIDDIRSGFDMALIRAEKCFSKINSKYFTDGKQVFFDHLNGDQYAMFLYLMSNSLFKLNKDLSICAKVFALNKLLHGLDAFYEVDLPEYFLFVHPLGTVLGRGRYSNFFVVYQRCGIGANHGVYPDIGENVTLYPGSSVLGSSSIGKNTKISTGSTVLDQEVPESSIYIGQPGAFEIKKSNRIDTFWRI